MTDDTRSYAVPTETISSLDLSHHLHDLMEIRTFLESRGIETRNTRIERYGKYLELSLSDGAESVDTEKIFKNAAGKPFRSPVDWHLYILREVHELMWILKGLKAHVPVGADEKLRLIAGGRDFAALDVDSQSRNTQFELRIASYFCQSGCEVDVSTDTDVIALTDRHLFFLECKRIGSKNKLRTRLSEARGQLARRMPRKGLKQRPLGCIAIDVTRVAFTHNGLTWDKFIFFEVSFLPRDVIAEWRREMSVDRAMGSLILLASLYRRRYPYEESERIAQPGSRAVAAAPRSGTEA